MMRFVKTGLAALAFAGVSGQALALSCMQPDVRRSVNWWIDSPDPYYISVGTLTRIGPLPKVPQFDGINQNLEPVSAEYRFVGEALWTERTFPLDRSVTVTVDCVASWCGGFPQDGATGIMGLKVEEGGGLSLTTGPCDGPFFDASHAKMVQGCLRDGRCDVPERQ